MGKNILTAPYVTLTPHLGGWSSTAARGMSDMVLSNVDAFLGGERPPNELPELKNWEEGWKWTK
jgi:phosphoglycerate dehydrogenase-like enzyme